MDIVVCVTTVNKKRDDILGLYKSINISGDALFCNQNGHRESFSLTIDCHIIRVECFDDIGVSKNRNHILDNCFGDVCINIDDDCRLVDNYKEIVESFFTSQSNIQLVQFNGIYDKEDYRKIHNKKDKRIKSFNDVSYAGGPGLAYKPDVIKELNIRYNEKVGYPNKVFLGEDSLFLKAIVGTKVCFYRSSIVLFNVVEDIDNSSYFKGVDSQYCVSKGAITKFLHPYLFWIYAFHYTYKIKHWRNCKLSYFKIFRYIRKGFRISSKIK